MDEIFQIGFAGREEIFTDTREHFGSGWGGIGSGNFKGEGFYF